jgi:hypothetical protein
VGGIKPPLSVKRPCALHDFSDLKQSDESGGRKRPLRQNYYTHAFTLLVKIVLRSEFLCRNVFDQISFCMKSLNRTADVQQSDEEQS